MIKVSSEGLRRAGRARGGQIRSAKRTGLTLVAGTDRDLMAHRMAARRRIVQWMRRRCACLRGDRLRASQMQRGLAGDPGPETKTTVAVMAPIFRHRAQRVALRVVAGPAAWAAGKSRGWNYDNAHRFILAGVFSPNLKILDYVSKSILGNLTACSKTATYS